MTANEEAFVVKIELCYGGISVTLIFFEGSVNIINDLNVVFSILTYCNLGALENFCR